MIVLVEQVWHLGFKNGEEKVERNESHNECPSSQFKVLNFIGIMGSYHINSPRQFLQLRQQPTLHPSPLPILPYLYIHLFFIISFKTAPSISTSQVFIFLQTEIPWPHHFYYVLFLLVFGTSK